MELENFKEGIMAVVIIAVIVGAAAIGIDAFRSDLIGDIPASTATEEAMTLNNATAQSVTNDWVVSVTTVKAAYNSTDNITLATSEYTVASLNSDTPATILLVNDSYNGNSSYITYTYRDETSNVQTNVTSEGLEGMSNATSYLGTIGTIIGISALIAVIMGAFYFVSKKIE